MGLTGTEIREFLINAVVRKAKNKPMYIMGRTATEKDFAVKLIELAAGQEYGFDIKYEAVLPKAEKMIATMLNDARKALAKGKLTEAIEEKAAHDIETNVQKLRKLLSTEKKQSKPWDSSDNIALLEIVLIATTIAIAVIGGYFTTIKPDNKAPLKDLRQKALAPEKPLNH